MSNEKQFEQWCQSVMIDDADFCMEYGMYINYSVRLYWQAWQAATHAASAKLTSQLESVVAENAALKQFIKNDCWIYDLDDEQYRDAVDYAAETPATDAFLAEVRADGVDMFAKHCQTRHGEMMKSEPNEAASNEAITATRRAGEFALYFAAQLRQGGAV
jgi:delta 1-pyrroline-5-carboxylate dehydrogenase